MSNHFYAKKKCFKELLYKESKTSWKREKCDPPSPPKNLQCLIPL